MNERVDNIEESKRHSRGQRGLSTNQALELGIARRIASLTFGIGYVFFIAYIWASATRIKPSLAVILVVVASIVIMACLCVFSVRLTEMRNARRQFSLMSLLLLMIPLAVYLAAIRVVWQQLPADASVAVRVIGVCLSLAFIIYSTAALLLLAESLMWTGVAIVAFLRRLQRR